MKGILQKLGIIRPDGSMSVRMRRTLWFTAAALLLIAACNGVILSRVAQNRAAPDAELALSGREVASQSGLFEDSGRFVRLLHQYVCAADENQLWYNGLFHPWLDAGKLAELGYRNLDAPKEPPFPRYPDKKVWVVLELDGPAYARYVAHYEAFHARAAAALAAETEPGEARNRALANFEEAERYLRKAREEDSRLVLIDAGLDAAALRRHYPDRARYVILPGRVRLGISANRYAQGKITWRFDPRVTLEPNTVFVPLQFADAFAAIDRNKAKNARLLLAVGARLEPWIKDLRIE